MTAPRQRLFPLIVTTVALVTVGYVGSTVVSLASLIPKLGVAGSLVLGLLILTNITAIAACLLALTLVWRAMDRADARALALFLVFLGLFWGSVFHFMSFQYNAAARELTFGLSMGIGPVQLSYAALLLSIAGFLHFSILFPQPLARETIVASSKLRPAKALREWCANPLVIWGIPLALIAWLVIPHLGGATPEFQPRDLADVFATLGVKGMISAVFMAAFYVALPAILIAVGTLNLRDGHRASTGGGRRRSSWVVTGFVTSAWMALIPVILFFVPLPSSVSFLGYATGLLFVAPTVLLVFLAVGIFNAGAMNPELVLRRSTVVGAFSGLVIVGFALLESITSELLEARIGGVGDMVSAVVAGVLVAVLLIPFRGRIMRSIEIWAARTVGVGRGMSATELE